MKQTYRHIDGVEIMPAFSRCGNFRYNLVVDLESKPLGRSVCAIMQNPSYACEEFADRSVKFLETLIFKKEKREFFDVTRLIVVNQFAFIQTKDFKGNEEKIGEPNDFFIDDALRQSDIALVAWGKSNKYKKRKETILELISNHTFDSVYEAKRHPAYGFYENYLTRMSRTIKVQIG